jgi:hypothetical protein
LLRQTADTPQVERQVVGFEVTRNLAHLEPTQEFRGAADWYHANTLKRGSVCAEWTASTRLLAKDNSTP